MQAGAAAAAQVQSFGAGVDAHGHQRFIAALRSRRGLHHGAHGLFGIAGQEHFLAHADRLGRCDAVHAALEQLEEIGRHIDYVLIDCPPSMSLLPINALVAAHEVLIPVQCEYYALEGLTQLLRTIDSARTSANPSLEVSTNILTMFSRNTNLSADVAANVREFFPQETLETEIPRSIRIAESPSFGETVISYAPRSSGAVAYYAAAAEIARRAE